MAIVISFCDVFYKWISYSKRPTIYFTRPKTWCAVEVRVVCQVGISGVRTMVLASW